MDIKITDMDSSSYQSFLDSLLIVLVLYKSDLESSDSFQSLDNCFKAHNASADIFIYDNSPQRLTIDLAYYKNVHYVWDATNPGVSKAYNEGFSFAEKNGKKWLLILDQDTKFQPDFLTKYYAAWTDNPGACLFAPILKLESGEIYSPCKYKFPRTFLLKEIDLGITSIKDLSLLNSGIAIDTSTFKEVGGYDERLKLDFSDFEFIDRYRNIRNNFVVVDTTGIHGFSGFQDKLDASAIRFNRYCQSFVVMCSIRSNFIEQIMLVTIALARAIKLSLKFKSLQFIVIFLKIFVSDNLSFESFTHPRGSGKN